MSTSESSKKKPSTPEEALTNLEEHPERGKIGGKEVVDRKGKEVRFTIPGEMYKQILEIGGLLGMNKTGVLKLMAVSFIREYAPLHKHLMEEKIRDFLPDLDEESAKQVITAKILGSFKQVAYTNLSKMRKESEE